MSLLEIEQAAQALSLGERAALVTTLLDTIPGPDTDVSDEDVLRRDRELEDGSVQAISQAEFVRRVEMARGR